jgi:hypothetical protein
MTAPITRHVDQATKATAPTVAVRELMLMATALTPGAGPRRPSPPAAGRHRWCMETPGRRRGARAPECAQCRSAVYAGSVREGVRHHEAQLRTAPDAVARPGQDQTSNASDGYRLQPAPELARARREGGLKRAQLAPSLGQPAATSQAGRDNNAAARPRRVEALDSEQINACAHRSHQPTSHTKV